MTQDQELINWMNVLNEEATWKDTGGFLRWASQVFGRPIQIDARGCDSFLSALRYMREQLAHLHFGEALETDWLNNELSQVRPGLSPSKAGALPAFSARPRGDSDAHQIEALKQTLLLQFAQFLGAALDNSETTIARCEGLYRTPKAEQSHAIQSPSINDKELRWRREIPLLVENDLDSTNEILRCEDFFVPTPKARFCSDACRFATFQIAKQIESPHYLSQKQKRYRERQEQSKKKKK